MGAGAQSIGYPRIAALSGAGVKEVRKFLPSPFRCMNAWMKCAKAWVYRHTNPCIRESASESEREESAKSKRARTMSGNARHGQPLPV